MAEAGEEDRWGGQQEVLLHLLSSETHDVVDVTLKTQQPNVERALT